MAPTPDDDDLLPEYDLSKLKGGVRGKYFDKYQSRLHLVRISEELAAAFPTEESVDRALKMLVELARDQVKTPSA